MPALVVLSFGSLGLFVPSPAGMGSYQYLVVKALSMYGVSTFAGFSFANVQFFTIGILSTIIFGILAYLLLPIINK
jgi:hypothetical protein